MALDLRKEYVDEQIELYGEIQEFDDQISHCPYCGYGNEIVNDGELSFDTEYITECGECEKEYIEILELYWRIYSTTRRIKESDYE